MVCVIGVNSKHDSMQDLEAVIQLRVCLLGSCESPQI
jgi:hypothetical protein